MSGDAGRVGAWSVRLRLTVLAAGLLAVALAVGALAFASALSASRVGDLDRTVRARAEPSPASWTPSASPSLSP